MKKVVKLIIIDWPCGKRKMAGILQVYADPSDIEKHSLPGPFGEYSSFPQHGFTLCLLLILPCNFLLDSAPTQETLQ